MVLSFALMAACKGAFAARLAAPCYNHLVNQLELLLSHDVYKMCFSAIVVYKLIMTMQAMYSV